jgi:hypothetical protein
MVASPSYQYLAIDKDDVLHWRGTWQFTATETLGYWGSLKSALNSRITLVDRIVVYLNTTAAEGYYLFLYQGPTGSSALQGPSGTSTAGAGTYHTYDGPYGPLLVDASTDAFSVGIYPIDGAWTAGDTMNVFLCGRALPSKQTISEPTARPVDLARASIFRRY